MKGLFGASGWSWISMIYTNRYTVHLQREQLVLRTESSLSGSEYLMLSCDWPIFRKYMTRLYRILRSSFDVLGKVTHQKRSRKLPKISVSLALIAGWWQQNNIIFKSMCLRVLPMSMLRPKLHLQASVCNSVCGCLQLVHGFAHWTPCFWPPMLNLENKELLQKITRRSCTWHSHRIAPW